MRMPCYERFQSPMDAKLFQCRHVSGALESWIIFSLWRIEFEESRVLSDLLCRLDI